MADTIAIDNMINKFKLYENSHPNLSNFWMAYLELKKEHYDSERCNYVLRMLEQGATDLSIGNIITLLMCKELLLSPSHNE